MKRQTPLVCHDKKYSVAAAAVPQAPSEAAADRGVWQRQLREALECETTLAVLGQFLITNLSSLPTPFGRFGDSLALYCRSPQSGTGPTIRVRDVLPVPLRGIRERAMKALTADTTKEMIREIGSWVWAYLVLYSLNFHWCAGWQEDCMVSLDHDEVPTAKQIEIIRFVREASWEFLDGDDAPLHMAEKYVTKLHMYQELDYTGESLSVRRELEAAKVVPAWPKVGSAAVRPVTEHVTDQLLFAPQRSPQVFEATGRVAD